MNPFGMYEPCSIVFIAGLAFYEDLNTSVSKPEAVALRDFIYTELASIQSGMTVELCGGFRR